MAKTAVATRETWGGRSAFIIAAISSAIGLGNIWRFPGVAYENGGGAFLLPYLVAFVTAGLPILFLDYALGHRYRAAPPLAFRRLNRKAEPIGWWQVGVSYLIIIYYAVVIAWALSFVYFSFNRAWGEDAGAFFFGDYLNISEEVTFTTQLVPGVLVTLLVIWVAAILVMSLGLRKGLAKANKITLPLLVIVFSVLVAYALTLPGAWEGVNTFFQPNFAELSNPQVWIAAYGHIFFSFSIAFGIMLTYSSYVKRKSDLTGSGLVVAFANCGFEILAGIGVFAALGFLAFNHQTDIAGLEGISGVSLAFITFPTILTEMPAGQIMGVLFFGSLVLAGFTSLLSLLQVVVGAIQDKTGWSSRRASVTVGLTAAIPSIALFSTTSGLHTLDVLDAWVNNIGVVTSAVVMLVVVGLVLRKTDVLANHLNAISTFKVGKIWQILVVFVTPAILTVILVTGAYSYIVDGYGTVPQWFVNIAGWGAIGLLLLFAFGMSYQRYRRVDADTFEPDDSGELAAEVKADRSKLEGAGSYGS